MSGALRALVLALLAVSCAALPFNLNLGKLRRRPSGGRREIGGQRAAGPLQNTDESFFVYVGASDCSGTPTGSIDLDLQTCFYSGSFSLKLASLGSDCDHSSNGRKLKIMAWDNNACNGGPRETQDISPDQCYSFSVGDGFRIKGAPPPNLSGEQVCGIIELAALGDGTPFDITAYQNADCTGTSSLLTDDDAPSPPERRSISGGATTPDCDELCTQQGRTCCVEQTYSAVRRSCVTKTGEQPSNTAIVCKGDAIVIGYEVYNTTDCSNDPLSSMVVSSSECTSNTIMIIQGGFPMSVQVNLKITRVSSVICRVIRLLQGTSELPGGFRSDADQAKLVLSPAMQERFKDLYDRTEGAASAATSVLLMAAAFLMLVA